MNKLILVLLLASVFSFGCDKPMTNQEIIDQRNLCLKNKMDYIIYQNTWTSNVVKVVCSGELK